MEHKSERIKIALLGSAIGDALGVPLEFMSAKEIAEKHGKVTEMLFGGWLQTDEPGVISDDTEGLLCCLRSLVECKGYDAHDIATRLVQWYDDDPIDIGRTVRAGLHRYAKTRELERPECHDQAGNGSCLRILPLIIAKVPIHNVVSHCHLTHNNAQADEGCRCYYELITAVLSGASKDDLRKIADGYPLFAPNKFDGNSDGYIVSTLRTVFYYFFETESFEDCLIAVVNNGQDADSTGALAGGLAGAFYGSSADAIPARWLEALDRDVHNEHVQLSEQLVTLRETL